MILEVVVSVPSVLGRAAGAAWRVPASSVRSLLVERNNRLARCVGNTGFVDKLMKLTKSSADVASGIFSCQEGVEDSLMLSQRVSKVVGDARAVVALTNAFRGALPGCLHATKACYTRLSRCLDQDEKGSRRVHAAGALKEACAAVSAGGFFVTFAGLRPVLFANKLANKPFLSSQVKTALGDGVSYTMAAAHAASVIGGAASLYIENVEHGREQQQLWCDLAQEDKDARRQEHCARVKGILLNILEKALEVVADVLKLVPMGLSAGVQLAASSGCVLASCLVGLYVMWGKA